MPRRVGRRRFLQISASAAVAGVAYGTLGIPSAQLRAKPTARRVLTKEFHLGRSELSQGSRSGLTVGVRGLELGRGRGAGHYLSRILRSDLPFNYVGLFWSGSNLDGSSFGFWMRTSPDGRTWSQWEAVHVEIPPGPLAQYDTYGSLIWADRANYVQFLGELRGASKKPSLRRIGLMLLNPYDGPILETAADLSDGGFANTALATEADSRVATGAAAAASGKPVTFRREDWGADESVRFSGGQEIWPRSYVPTKKLVVHHTVTGNGYPTVEDAKATVRAIYTYHARALGWGDIGYNSLVDKFGNSYEGRRGRDGPGYDGPGGREILSEDVVAGHAFSHNHGSTGIALLGSFSSVSPSSAALSRLRDVLAWECGRHGINPQASTDFLKASDSWNRGLANICGHRDTQATACPGSSLYALLPGLRSDTASRLANSSAPTVSITSAPSQGTRTDPNVSYAWQGSGGSGAKEYSYYLEGWSLDEDVLVVYKSGFNAAHEPAWGAWTAATQASFILDQPGHYTFHVRARDSQGKVSVYQDNRTFLGTAQERSYGFSPAVWRPSTGTWYVKGRPTVQWGLPGDIPVPGDYNGDGKIDLAVWRPSAGSWYIPGQAPVQWGLAGDIPVAGDYRGDGRTGMAVWRPSNGTWYIKGHPAVQWGLPGDIPVAGDYNGDGKADLAVWRPSTGTWYIRGHSAVQWGLPGDIPVLSDYNGDGKADLAVWRPSTGTWYVRGLAKVQWGQPGDVPVPADYSGNGKADLAVWRPSTGTWYVWGLAKAQWGQPGDIPVLGVARDIPVPGDYSGDGKTDLAVWRPSNGSWYVQGRPRVQWGLPWDIPAPGNYNGDGKTDLAVWRPSTGTWYVPGRPNVQWGLSGDIPVPGDYNGDGKTDLAVWRASNGSWYVLGRPRVQWGLKGDIPVPGDYSGDGKTDLAVWRPSTGTWYVRGRTPVQWGLPGDIPVAGDYRGDGRTGMAVWRPSTGTWYVRGRTPVQWGLPGDIPVPGDYNGDGKMDLAVWRPSTGIWYVRGLAKVQWGLPGIPVG